MACCDYPGCGKLIYVYNKEKNLTIKHKAHTVPTNARQQVVELLNMPPEKAKKVQFILCHTHFRPDAYLETNSARLRRDLPFTDLLLLPGTPSKHKRSSLAPPKPAKSYQDSFLNRTIAAPPVPRLDAPRFSLSSSNLMQFSTPSLLFPDQNLAPTAAANGLKASAVSNNENKSKLDFDMKKFRIEVTMKHLLKERELEAKLKESESQAREFKGKLDSAHAELSCKKDEAAYLKAEIENLRRELGLLKSKLDEESKLRSEAEKKHALLKGDLQITCELYNAEQTRSKRIKLEDGSETESDSAAVSEDEPALQARLAELEEKLKEANDRREADLNAKDKVILEMKKEIKDLHLENQQLYDSNVALDMDIRAYRKLVLLEEQRSMANSSSGLKKRRTLDESKKDEPTGPTATSSHA